MKVSDELVNELLAWMALYDKNDLNVAVMLSRLTAFTIPRIVALERCRELLVSYRWTFDYPAQVNTCSSCDQSISRGCAADCEIAIALEATP